jgi:hypothetical protein
MDNKVRYWEDIVGDSWINYPVWEDLKPHVCFTCKAKLAFGQKYQMAIPLFDHLQNGSATLYTC